MPLRPSHGPGSAPESQLVSDPIAARILARASELDASQASGVMVAELRAAAAEAGISDRAFNTALAEMHEEQVPAAAPVRARPSRVARAMGIVAAIAVATLFVGRLIVPSKQTVESAGLQLTEQPILLNCLAPGEAASLVQPLLTLPQNRVLANPASAPRVLTVRATAEQMARVHALLDQYEQPGSAACAARPAVAPPAPQ